MSEQNDLQLLAQEVMRLSVQASFMDLDVVSLDLSRVFDDIVEHVRRVKEQVSEEDQEVVSGVESGG